MLMQLLGCSQVGSGILFPAYAGDASMYSTHKLVPLSRLLAPCVNP